MIRGQPRYALFAYTALFRSLTGRGAVTALIGRRPGAGDIVAVAATGRADIPKGQRRRAPDLACGLASEGHAVLALYRRIPFAAAEYTNYGILHRKTLLSRGT